MRISIQWAFCYSIWFMQNEIRLGFRENLSPNQSKNNNRRKIHMWLWKPLILEFLLLLGPSVIRAASHSVDDPLQSPRRRRWRTKRNRRPAFAAWTRVPLQHNRGRSCSAQKWAGQSRSNNGSGRQQQSLPSLPEQPRRRRPSIAKRTKCTGEVRQMIQNCHQSSAHLFFDRGDQWKVVRTRQDTSV